MKTINISICLTFLILGFISTFTLDGPLFSFANFESTKRLIGLENVEIFLFYLVISILFFWKRKQLGSIGLFVLLLLNYLILPGLIVLTFFNGSDGQQLFYLLPVFIFVLLLAIPLTYFYTKK